MINVLVVEDSPVARELLVHILKRDPELRVIGTARDGEEAIEFLARHRPDVITMDLVMPRVDGIEATRRIMETQPVPIVIVSGAWNREEVETTFRAMEAGAVALVEKPCGLGDPKCEGMSRDLVQTVKSMSEVRVVRRWARRTSPSAAPAAGAPSARPAPARIGVVAIGVSTGGPPVLRAILGRLPKRFDAAVLIVQHIAAGFLPGLAEWLGSATGFPVRVARDGEAPLPGCAYLAPDGRHMALDAKMRIRLSDDPPENGLKPAVSFLFRSVAEVCGANAVGVLLTGMGRDGAAELSRMRARGAITIVQDKESSVVHGMPGEAIRLNAATHVLPPEGIAGKLMELIPGGAP
jgi:two-component system, chemotaxis family, protein-glutamate methylesterase/glutaminase